MTGQVTAVIPVAAPTPGPLRANSPRTGTPSTGTPRTDQPDGLSFHAILSALNPLQYLPVVGTIYRAVTGDTIPEAERRIGSLIVSGLMGGPVGMAINLVTMALEKITGIDLDRAGQALLHGEPLGQAVAGQTAAKQDAVTAPPPAAPPQHADTTPQLHPGAAPASHAPAPTQTASAWSTAALAAYGVRSNDAGTLRMAGVQGADVLNTLELARLHTARSAYARVAALGG